MSDVTEMDLVCDMLGQASSHAEAAKEDGPYKIHRLFAASRFLKMANEKLEKEFWKLKGDGNYEKI